VTGTGTWYPPTADLRTPEDRVDEDPAYTECGDCGIPFRRGTRHRCPCSQADWWGVGYREARAGRMDPPPMSTHEFDQYMSGRDSAAADMHSKGF